MSAPDVAIIDSGGANLASLRYALVRLGATSVVTAEPGAIKAAPRVLLPGVGSAADAMNRLREGGLDALLPTLRQPVLGICLGMQLLFEHSEEGNTCCLGVLPGRIGKLVPREGRPVPHMGWNQLVPQRDSPLLEGIHASSHVYFVHSYAANRSADCDATADYQGELAALVRRDNFCGAQFHPERSGEVGARVLKNFLDWSP